jgi:hypothetical protein
MDHQPGGWEGRQHRDWIQLICRGLGMVADCGLKIADSWSPRRWMYPTIDGEVKSDRPPFFILSTATPRAAVTHGMTPAPPSTVILSSGTPCTVVTK